VKENFYLGLSFGFNASACVISNKRGLLAAVSQERFSGNKNTKEVPFEAANKCLEIAEICRLDGIAYCHYENTTIEALRKYTKHELSGSTVEEVIHNHINIKCDRIERFDHHTAHGLSTFGFYGMPESNDHYIITSDGFGDGSSARIIYDNEVISDVKLKNSIALVYQFVTGALGFKEHQHEGKITGLAAYGEPRYVKVFEKLFDEVDFGNFLDFRSDDFKLTSDEEKAVADSQIINFDDFLKLKRAVYELVHVGMDAYNATREDISASVQEFAEKWTLKWLKANCKEKRDAYLAGGLFANVKINQRIKDSGLFNNVYVCPAMGDEGTCVGAAIEMSIRDGEYISGLNESAFKKVVSGSYIRKDKCDVFDEICNEINKRGLLDTYRVRFENKQSDVIDTIVNDLTHKKIVCVIRHRMEFGPRALCHRSILYDATEKETNDSLNKRLSRSEFMPFAPVCKIEVAEDLFKNLDGGRESARFMTMTFDGTDEFVNTYKAVAHIDGTARPQTINRDDDPFIWTILDKYQDKTDLKCLVNTSFNLHEQPIIENEITALNSFLKAELDTLIIDDTIIVERI
jgi:carbamoyltransferase